MVWEIPTGAGMFNIASSIASQLGLFGPFLQIITFVVIFFGLKEYKTSAAWVASSFICLILAYLWAALTLTGEYMVLVFFAATVFGGLALVFDQ